ncbi:hypothetical protein [Streptomyces sp. TRM68367]|uniref:hypothetical protein n=1 Tax=Streptomyces sp. TRM68367 TaxID=2758415 RepID=UPI00293457C2|nr:hypothetical protein [Streptomyces sp. TRM68367]
MGDDIRVRGRTTVEAGAGGTGRVTIKADYTFVYPLVRAAGGDEVARTIIRRVVEVDVPDPARYQVTEGRLWLVAVDSEIGNDLCREGDGFIHPLFDSELSAARQPTGEERDPYDRSKELTGAGRECGTVTRT